MDFDPEFSSQISSPGLGTTSQLLSADPLASEGEATEGPDDEIPVDLADADMGERDVEDLPAVDGELGVPRDFELPTLDGLF